MRKEMINYTGDSGVQEATWSSSLLLPHVLRIKMGLHLERFDPSRRMIEPGKAGSTLVLVPMMRYIAFDLIHMSCN